MSFPFPGFGVKGVFKPKESKYCYETAIRNILMTMRGTVPWRPDFGSEIRKFVFDLNDDISKQLILYYAYRDVSDQEPRLRLVSLDAEFDEENYKISFTVGFIAYDDPSQQPRLARIQDVPMRQAA
jgi:hypothetical protein